MTTADPTPRTAPNDRHDRAGWGRVRRWVSAALLATCLAAVGCKSTDDGKGRTPSRNTDPLVVGPGRIPKQNLPVPDRGTAGGGVRADPLLGEPTSRPGQRTGYTDDPERWKGGPYTPDKHATPAALTNRLRDDGDELKIDSPGGVKLTPVGGSFPSDAPRPAPPAPMTVTASEPLYADLGRYGVKRGDYTAAREHGGYVVRVKVPNAKTGAATGYTGTGPTEAAAVKQVIDQVKADRR